MAQALRVWDWRPGTPLGMTGDAPWMATLVRGYIEHGPYADNPLFGAPFELNTGWSSTGNDLHVWILTALGAFTDDPFTVLAIYFFLTFPLSAVSMYWLCRRYGVATPAAVMAGVLFSVVPGHQERFPHLFLAAYWAVPFAAWVLIEIAGGRSVLTPRSPRAGGDNRMRLVAAALALLAIGLGDVYYVAFTLILAVPLIVLRQLRRPNLRELFALALPLLVIVVPTLISIGLARRRADRDPVTGGMPFGRTFLDSDRWAGQFVDLVLPWPGHRVPSLGARTQAYDALTGTTGEISAIGIVAVLGIAAVLAVVGAAVLRGRLGSVDPLVAALAVAVLLAAAFFTRGGLGALTAFLVTPQIRTWSRLFLFIALFGLLGIAWFVTRLSRRRDGQRHVVAASILLLFIGVLDQTNPGRAPDYAANRAQLSVLSTFTDDVEGQLGSDCSMFVLPVVGFPEVNDDLWFDLMSLGLASKDLRWSFGAIRGTAPADWQLGLSSDDGRRLVDDLASLDYCGVVVESSLTERSPVLASQLPTLLGQPVARSTDQRYAAYDLRGSRQGLESRLGAAGVQARSQAVLHPLVASLTGAWAVDEASGRRYPLGPSPAVGLSNMSDAPVRVTLDVSVMGAEDGETQFFLEGLGTRSETKTLGPRERGELTFTATAPPGSSSVGIGTGGVGADWAAYAEPSALPSVVSVKITSQDAAVNVGLDLPTP